MSNAELSAFLVEKVRSGAKKADIKEQLLSVGWPEDEIDAAYARALVECGVPVPESARAGKYAKHASTVEVVLNLFSFILLGIIATALGVLYFEVINNFFPDPSVNDAYGSRVSSGAVHYSIAALIIGFPMYYFSIRLWFRKFREDEGKVESLLTKWITYLVLLAASVTIVGDLIAVLFTFLQGEMSARFFLKALTILSIAAMVFGFYFLERKRVQYGQDIPRKVFQSFAWGLLGVTVLGIILGFLAVGSPAMERKRTFDARRAEDLSNLAGCINNYAQEYKRLPRSISDLSKSGNYDYCSKSSDPETNAPYEYDVIVSERVVGANVEAEFELCATFSLASDAGVTSDEYSYYGNEGGKWHTHTAGRNCDSQSVVLGLVKDLPPVK